MFFSTSCTLLRSCIGHGPAHQREDAEEEHNDLEEEANGEPRPYVSWLFIAS